MLTRASSLLTVMGPSHGPNKLFRQEIRVNEEQFLDSKVNLGMSDEDAEKVERLKRLQMV